MNEQGLKDRLKNIATNLNLPKHISNVIKEANVWLEQNTPALFATA